MKSTLIILALWLCSIPVFSQSSINGTIVNERNEVVPYATMFLKQQSDSSLIKGEVSDENGLFEFLDLKPGAYFIQINYLGYSNWTKEIIIAADQETKLDLGTIQLIPLSSELQTVTVVAEKPFIEKQADKTVVNIENSIIQTGSSLMEVLEKLPGVQVDQDGNIRMRGKQGVIVVIDGKPTGLGGQDLANLLRGMPSANVQKIEIITNPSAKWDAAGNAGILNIVTKKSKQNGSSGTINLSYGQGRYGKYNGAVNYNFKKNKINFFLSYNFSNRKGFNHLDIDRNFFVNDTVRTRFLTNNYIIYPFNTSIVRMGLDYYLSKKTTLSFLGSNIVNGLDATTTSHTNILNEFSQKMNSYEFYQTSKELFYNYDFNIQLTHKFDSTGKELVINLDHVKYWNNADQLFTNLYYDQSNNLDSLYLLTGLQRGVLSLYSIKADYTQSLKKNATLDAGIKSSLVNSDRDMRFYQHESETEVFDSLRSSHFLYSENINAAYISVNKKMKKLTLQLGLRGEHTYAKGKQLLNNVEFTRNYAQVFPTAYINYEFNEKHNVNVNLGRRIDRPGYEQLNPFRNMIDATTYSEGNPFLLPQLSYNTEFSYSYDNSFFITLNYNFTNDNITDVLIQDAATQTTVQTVVNLNKLNFYSLDLTYSKRLLKWWRMNLNAISYFGQYSGTVNDFTVENGRPSVFFSAGNNFTIKEGFSAECSYRYNYQNLYGVTLMKTTSSLSVGVQKSLLKNRGSLTLNFTDIFWKAYPSGITDFGNVIEYWTAIRDTRVFTAAFMYKFGKGQGGKMRKTTGADEERNRAS